MKGQLILLTCILFLSLAFSHCDIAKNGLVRIPDKPFGKLSEYGFFEGALSNLEPGKGVLPYDLNSPLFSDYAHKARFIWMPEGTSAQYTTDHVLDFPVGTALIKNFYYNNDESDISRGKRILETRILINRGEEWDAYGYIWDDTGEEAHYDVIGGILEVSWVDAEGTRNEINYLTPNKNQCKSCHAYDNRLKPIGPKVRNLNKEFTYRDGAMNQLKKWIEVGYLKGMADDLVPPKVAVWDDDTHYSVQDRAMAYLDINCGHCHNPSGAANTSGLTLLADSELGTALGIYKPTVSAGAGTGGHTYSIVPGNPDESIMVYRMKSLDPGAMMPEIGRRMVHYEGVSLIAQWIDDMPVNDDDLSSKNQLN